MKIWNYRSYGEYVAKQTEHNRRKISSVWAHPQTIREICEDYGDAGRILCHGTRNGAEQKMFLDHYPRAEVLGTEISETAREFPRTCQWDFHEPREEWLGRWDIVYSNSFDHSIDPLGALRTWRDQLSDEPGCLYLELSLHGEASEVDPLSLSEEEFLDLAQEAGLVLKGRLRSHVSRSRWQQEPWVYKFAAQTSWHARALIV